MGTRSSLLRACSLIIVGGVGIASSASAQNKYPERTIRMVVPFAPAGGTDIMARLAAAKLSRLYGVQVIVENRTGGGGSIGTADVARAKPDGHTLLVGTTSTHSINPFTIKDLPYDAVKDFTPVYMLGTSTFSIIVHPSVASSLTDLIRRAKARPGSYSFGSSGTGGSTHLAGELFKRQAGKLDIVHVPYRGSAQSVTDLVSGQIPIIVSGFSSVASFYKTGRVRVLAAFSEKRIDFAPEIPTAIELGVPGMVAYTYNALFAPAATPAPIVEQLARDIVRFMGEPAFQKELMALGIEPIADSNPQKAAQAIREELAKWGPIIKEAGLTPQ